MAFLACVIGERRNHLYYAVCSDTPGGAGVYKKAGLQGFIVDDNAVANDDALALPVDDRGGRFHSHGRVPRVRVRRWTVVN